MHLRWLGVCLASTVALGAQSALAQPKTSCGADQALQSIDTSGRGVTCINVPDGAALQGQISAEVTARSVADAQLEGQLNVERAIRENADAALLNTINQAVGGAETSIVGTYTFSGTQSCLNSTFGFDQSTLTPLPSTDLNRAAVVSISTALTTGSRTFNPGGTGTVEFTTMSINYPGAFYSAGGFAGVTTGGPPSPAGGAVPAGNVSTILTTGTFNWHIEDGRLFIEDGNLPGTFIGGGRVGWSARVEGAPRSVAVLGKDLRLITLTNETVSVETTVTTSPAGEPFQEFRTPRLCGRERLLRKM